jgi:hypothetical protein
VGDGIGSIGLNTAPFGTSDNPMEYSAVRSDGDKPGPSPDAEQLIRQFVEHWGLMARAWGINSTMGELFALLYITGTDWTAEDYVIG